MYRSKIIVQLRKKAYLSIGFLLLFTHNLIAQDQSIADSISQIYKKGSFEQKDQLRLLNELAFNESDVEQKLIYSEELIRVSLERDSLERVYVGYYMKGNALILRGDGSQALESYLKGAEYASKANLNLNDIYIAIADVYAQMGNDRTSISYYQKAIVGNRAENDSIKLASALLNAGDLYYNLGILDTAMVTTKEAGVIFKLNDYPIGQAYALGNIGMIQAESGNDRLAEDNMNKAIHVLEKAKNYYPIAVYLTFIADIYTKKGNTSKALEYLHKSLEIAETHDLKPQIRDAHLKLSELYDLRQDRENALFHYKAHILQRDSINNLEEIQKLADLRTDFEVSQKQIEVDLLDEKNRTQRVIGLSLLTILFLITIGLLILFQFFKAVRKAKNRSDELLLNILPAETADELKAYGRVKAKKLDSVTVLFTDFKGFTKYADKLSPEELVEKIDYYFSHFDQIMERYGLEKIKTIGDAYMCAGGLPSPIEGHASKVILAAFDIRDFIEAEGKRESVKDPFEIRIGINTGPVIAGVVGIKKFAYDIWGDTVNIASRMESNSEPGMVNISQNTYEFVKDKFDCEYRGKLNVKGKGMMKMYFVKQGMLQPT